MSAQGSVGFRWGTITGPYHAKWKHKNSIHIGFIVFNGGVTTFFAKSVYCQNDLVQMFISNYHNNILLEKIY